MTWMSLLSWKRVKKKTELVSPDSMPEVLQDAVERVRRDFNLKHGWLNTAVANQWETSLPPSLTEDLTWRTYGGLRVGVAGRRPLIALKLLAVVELPRKMKSAQLSRRNR